MKHLIHLVMKLRSDTVFSHGNNLQKENDSCVGHCVRQSKDSTSHDCVAQVEDGHPNWCFSLKLQTQIEMNMLLLHSIYCVLHLRVTWPYISKSCRFAVVCTWWELLSFWLVGCCIFCAVRTSVGEKNQQ